MSVLCQNRDSRGGSQLGELKLEAPEERIHARQLRNAIHQKRLKCSLEGWGVPLFREVQQCDWVARGSDLVSVAPRNKLLNRFALLPGQL